MSINNILQKNIFRNHCYNIFRKKEVRRSFFTTKKTTTGFTLVELMVSVALFSIVVAISMTAILSVVDANKKAQSMKSVMNNLNFALETMTRSIKTGTGLVIFQLGYVETTDQDENQIKYSLGTGDNAGSIVRVVNGGLQEVLTAPEVQITSLAFINITSSQPSVVMIIRGIAKANARVSSEFNIQTTITQRSPGI